MGLSKLMELAAYYEGELKPVTIRLPEDMLAHADILADEVGVSRSDVIREALSTGLSGMFGEWEQAKANAKGGKRRAAS